MARIRSIKPEFWTDPDIVAMPMAARLFFVGCWNHADDYGVLKDEPARLKLQIMPADDVDAEAIVDELVERRHLVRMVAPDGTRVLVVRTFGVHQKIDKRAVGRWGEPDDFRPIDAESRPIPTDPAESPPDPDQSPPIPTLEGKGREGSGKEKTLSSIEPATSSEPIPLPGSPPAVAESTKTTVEDQWNQWWTAYPRKVGKQAARKAWDRARKKRSAADLQAALEAHLPAMAATDPQFVPNPATWLGQGRYEDPPPTPRRRPTDNRAKIDASLARLKAASQ